MNFDELGLSKTLLKAIEEEGYTHPTQIQEKAIPYLMQGLDVVGCAPTGTGKTFAFSIPIIHHLQKIAGSAKRHKKIRCLIVSPTRELAVQIGQSMDTYAKYTNLTQLTVFGGVSQTPQVDGLKKGVDVLIGTPGRLLDLHKQGFINLDDLHFLVLDEADQMLDMGFINDIKKIIKLTPDNKQTILFSATMPISIRVLAEEILKNPKWVEVAPVSSTAEKVSQQIYYVGKEDKRKLLYHIIRNQKMNDVLVFVRTKHAAENVVKALLKNNIQADSIHGDKSQSARQQALDRFKNKETTVLVATDIAARGIDIDQLPFVINFNLPNIPETYVHRIGRTARAGYEGTAISFCSTDEISYWKDIEQLIKTKVKTIVDHPYPILGQETPSASSSTKPKQKPKPDLRNKPKTKSSRKSENSKKNKKRWY